MGAGIFAATRKPLPLTQGAPHAWVLPHPLIQKSGWLGWLGRSGCQTLTLTERGVQGSPEPSARSRPWVGVQKGSSGFVRLLRAVVRLGAPIPTAFRFLYFQSPERTPKPPNGDVTESPVTWGENDSVHRLPAGQRPGEVPDPAQGCAPLAQSRAPLAQSQTPAGSGLSLPPTPAAAPPTPPTAWPRPLFRPSLPPRTPSI